MKSNKGFTLVELLVTILAASVITAAALTVLLLGMRINKQSNETSSAQNVVRIGISMLEDMAAEAKVTGADGTGVQKEGGTVFSYKSAEQAIYIGDGGTPLISDVTAFNATYNSTSKLLEFNLTVNGETYESKVYCRTAPDATTETTEDDTLQANGDEAAAPAAASAYVSAPTALSLSKVGTFENRARQAFLDVLMAEEGSTGRSSTGEYYSEWYIGSYEENPAWSEETPWCACFISWALDQCGAYLKEVPRYAHVDKFMESFDESHWKTADPAPGDIIFFDWGVDDERRAQHVGVVVSAEDGYVYTIEGNNNGKVAAAGYEADDPRILGYGELKWK